MIVVLHGRLSWQRGRDHAEEFLDELEEKHYISDAVFLVCGMGYLTALARTDPSGESEYSERNIVEKHFQSYPMRIERFHETWNSSQTSAGVVSATDEYSDSVFSVMSASRRFEVVEHLSNEELDDAINVAQKTDETRLVRRLCFVKTLYEGKTQQQAGAAVGVSQPTSSRWARAWNQDGIEGLRPRFGGGRPPKLTPTQWDDICAVLEDDQPWTPREIHALIEDRYGVTYHPTHLARKLRASGMHYAKPRPMDPRSPDDADEILAERLGQALGEDHQEEDDPIVLGFFR